MKNVLSKKGFLRNNIIFIAIVSVCCALSNASAVFSYIAIGVIVFCMAIMPVEYKFCWSMFLVPNVRLFDILGPTWIVSLLFSVPLIFSLLFNGKKIKGLPILGAIVLFFMELIHLFFYQRLPFDLLGWVLAFIWCCMITLDEDVNIDKEDLVHALAIGVVFSGVIYLINDPAMAGDLIDMVLVGHRFEGYASDPNAYSMYVYMALSAFVIKEKFKAVDFLFFFILIAFGIITASKMGFILLIMCLTFFVLRKEKHKKGLLTKLTVFALLAISVFLMWDVIVRFLDNIFDRFGGDYATLDSITSNRYSIVKDYLQILANNPSLLIFGKGFIYFELLTTITGQPAHNTYLDIILSWGIIGVFVFAVVLYLWVHNYKAKAKISGFAFSSFLPCIIVAVSFMSLSLFDSSMFFLVIAFCILLLESKPLNTGSNLNLKNYIR